MTMSSEENDVDRATAAAEEARETIAQTRKVRAVARALCEASRRLRSELRRQQGIPGPKHSLDDDARRA